MSLSLATNTVRTRLARLEDLLGCQLLERATTGVSLTHRGFDLREVAREMAAATSRIGHRPLTSSQQLHRVEIQVSEGLGTFWIIPRLADFHRMHPDILISLNCTLEPLNRFQSSNCIAVQMVKPEDPDAVCARLGSLHVMPFVSPAYLNQHGAPRSLQDARNHQLVIQTSEIMRSDFLPLLFGDDFPTNLIALETNSSAAHYWAVSKGVGIGMLPTYARAITRSVIPIDMELKLRRDIWLAYPLNAKKTKSVTTVITWLKSLFDSQSYPWFANDFIHPNDFEKQFEQSNVVELFSGIMEFGA